MKYHPFYSISLMITILLILSGSIAAQNASCSFQEHHEALVADDPNYKIQVQELRKKIKQNLKLMQKNSGNNYLVPVVFHVIYGNDATVNISEDQIIAQLDRLNDEFSGNPNSSTGESMDIQFCLAPFTIDGISNWSSFGGDDAQFGITRHLDPTNSVIGTGDHSALLTNYGFPPSEYLNIFVIQEITGGALGYSNFGGGLGVVIESRVVGNQDDPSCSCTLLADYELGMALVHEFGHFFGLNHPWGSSTGECSEHDDIDDTPITSGPNYNCPSGVNSCTEPNNDQLDMVENYMDYTDDICKNTFTAGQRCAMHTQVQANQFISELVSIQNLILTGVASSVGCMDPVLVPVLTVSDPVPCVGGSIDITLTSNVPLDSWELVINGGASPLIFSGGATIGGVVQPVVLNDQGSYSATVTYTSSQYSPPSTTSTFNDIAYVSNCVAGCDQAFWYFPQGGSGSGANAGVRMDFSDGGAGTFEIVPPFGSDQTTHAGATYTYSNCAGDYFSFDGEYLRDLNGAYLTNGGLFSENACSNLVTGGITTGSQSVLGVESGGNVNLFMISRLPYVSQVCTGVPMGMRLYTVDLDGNNGAPTVLESNPGNSPGENYSFADAISAIPHCNGQDTWVIAKGAGAVDPAYSPGPSTSSNEELFAYLFDGSVLSTPVVSGSGPFIVDDVAPTSSDWKAFVEVSPDGRWVIFSSAGQAYLYEFNALTGEFTFHLSLPCVWSPAFSASGDILYLKSNANPYPVVQYDFAHFRDCGELLATGEIEVHGNMQRGPNGKIYFWTNRNISIIHTPDVLIENGDVSAINLSLDVFEVPVFVPSLRTGSVPNLIEASTSTGIDFYCCVTNCNQVIFRAEGCANGYQWDLGNGQTPIGSEVSTVYQPDQTYTVSVTSSTGMTVSKDIFIGFPVPVEILPEGNLCMTSSMTYNLNLPGMIYSWSVTSGGTLVSLPDFSSATVIWDDPAVGGTVCVTVEDPASACTRTVCFDQDPCMPCTQLILSADVTPACMDDGQISLTVTGGSGQYIYDWDPAPLPPNSLLTGLPAGTYTVRVVDSQDVNCMGQLQVIVPADPNCGGSCTGPVISVNHGISPNAYCFESDQNFTDYYVNLHVPNWSGTQFNTFDFCTGSENVEFSVGQLMNPYIEDHGWVLEIEGFLQIPTSAQTTNVCVTFPVCLGDGSEVCAEFCFDLDPCDGECGFNVASDLTQTYIGPDNNPPCGIPGYDMFNMDFDVTIDLPLNWVGDHINVQLWGDVGQLCAPFLSHDEFNAPGSFPVNFQSLYNANNAKHFCYHVLVKNKTQDERCEENFCVPLEGPGYFVDATGGGHNDGDSDGKGKFALDQSGVDKPLHVFPTLVSDHLNVAGIMDPNWSYVIYSVDGRLISSRSLSDEFMQRVGLTDLNAGTYVLHLSNSVTRETQVDRFVKR